MKRRVIHEGNAGSYGVEEITLPNGSDYELQMLRHPGASAIVPFVTDDSVLLLRQFRHAAGGEIWEVPAGKIDPGEDPEVCAKRELEEETGYVAGRIEQSGVILTTPGFTDERIHLYVAFDLTPGKLNRGTNEVMEVHEFSFDAAMAMIDRGELIDSKSIAALYHAARLRRDS